MSNNFEKFRLRRNNGTDIYPVYAIFSSDIIETFKKRTKYCNSIQIIQTDVSNDFNLLIEDDIDIVVKDKNIFSQKSLKFSYIDMKGKKIVIPLENVLIIQEEDRENFHNYLENISKNITPKKSSTSGFPGIQPYNGTANMKGGSSTKKGKVHYGIRGGKYIIKKGKKIYL